MRCFVALLVLTSCALGQQPAPAPAPTPAPAPAPAPEAAPAPQLVTPSPLPGEKLPEGAEWKTTASGLRYVVLAAGDEKAAAPGPADRVTVNYAGFLEDGKQFDASKPKSPVTFALNQVIKGWAEALQLMHPGAKYKLHVPWQLGFGEKGRGPVPGQTNLICDMELISVKAAPPPPPPSPPMPSFSMPPDSELTTTPSGLKWKQLRAGRPDGKKPLATDTVNVWYAGWLTDGTYFDGNYGGGKLLTWPVARFIKGWQEALEMMPEGAVYQLVIPPGLGYGNQPNGKIPAASTLVFQMELVRVGA